MTIIWCMVPEIWSMTDIIFCHSGPFFFSFYTCNGSWVMECNRHNFFVILDRFLPFYPHTFRKIKILKKRKKHLEISFYTCVPCTINDSHMIYYGSWDMEGNGHNFLSLWVGFCPFTLLTTQKIKIMKKNK